jgi:CRISPR-associated endonuclease/helicase Cas3
MHLSATAKLASQHAAKFGAGEIAYVAGLLHDLGKYNPAFQQYLIDAHAGREAISVPHAVYGALAAFEQEVPELAQVIFGHHAGMPSVAGLQEAFANPETIETYQQVKEAANGVAGGGASSGVAVDLHGEMLLRMVFSALVDSDYIDTERHFDPGRAGRRTPGPRVAQLLPELLASQKRIMSGKTGAVNEVRKEVYESCLEAAKLPRGVFRLVAPTGAGKTRSALAFALSHAVQWSMDRVIYAVPFLTVTDQVGGVARSVFGPENVLEHHAGILTHEPSFRNRLATQNWDAPLVVTTTVQLLESLLSNRPSRCRKLHNITRSVIVLDEVQSLPVRLLQPIVSVLNELVERYGCTVVLSTATQPA